MGRFLIQPDKEKDLYILWSTVTDSPLVAGERKTLENVLLLDRIEAAKRDIDYMFDTVHVHCREMGDDSGEVYQGSHWLPSKNFLLSAERLTKDPDTDLSDLVEEIEDE